MFNRQPCSVQANTRMCFVMNKNCTDMEIIKYQVKSMKLRRTTPSKTLVVPIYTPLSYHFGTGDVNEKHSHTNGFVEF